MLKTAFSIFIISSNLIAGTYEMQDVLASDLKNTPELNQIIIATASIIRKTDDQFLDPRIFGEVYNFCANQKFLDQKMFSHCSGTLIAKNKILTAGHCVRSLEDCKDLRVAFDYLSNEDIPRIKNSSNQMYSCKKITAWSKSKSKTQLTDYAVIELDRDVTDRSAVIYNPKNQLQKEIKAFGHPLGLPMKLMSGFLDQTDTDYNSANSKNPFMKAHMNSHPGLSGAGVYNEKFQLSGILVRGESNIEPDGRCSRMRSCETGDCTWVEIQKLPKMN